MFDPPCDSSGNFPEVLSIKTIIKLQMFHNCCQLLPSSQAKEVVTRDPIFINLFTLCDHLDIFGSLQNKLEVKN